MFDKFIKISLAAVVFFSISVTLIKVVKDGPKAVEGIVKILSGK
jgi:hypothetical protein